MLCVRLVSYDVTLHEQIDSDFAGQLCNVTEANTSSSVGAALQ